MTDKTQRLIDERDRLTKRINIFQVNTPAREEKVKRIKEINKELQRLTEP